MPLNTQIIPSPEELDAGRRVSDAVNLHLIANPSDPMENVGRWTAFRLDTGEELDGKATYDSKDEAIFFAMPREHEYCYLEITPDGIRPMDAVRFLRINRHPMIDHLAPPHVIGPALFPRFSNLTRQQKNRLRRQAEARYLDGDRHTD